MDVQHTCLRLRLSSFAHGWMAIRPWQRLLHLRDHERDGVGGVQRFRCVRGKRPAWA